MSPKRISPLLLLVMTLSLLPTAVMADEPTALPETGRVVLAPLNMGVRAAPEVADGLEPVWDELVRMLEQRDPPPAALQRDAAAALWSEVVRSDEPGNERAGVYAAYGRFARRVAAQVEFDALVIPSLVMRKAEIHGHQASWDGVHRILDTPRPADLAWAGSLALGGRGSLDAASLHVAVLTPRGEIRFEGAGGIALLQGLALVESGGGSQVQVTPRPEPFADVDALREGVQAAFARPLPASGER